LRYKLVQTSPAYTQREREQCVNFDNQIFKHNVKSPHLVQQRPNFAGGYHELLEQLSPLTTQANTFKRASDGAEA